MSDLTVKFWGTRGSIPTPGRRTEKYGGNTTCLEIRYHDEIVVFDAGSGIRELGVAWMSEFRDRPMHASLLLTHLHWDHIQGFPFFAPAYSSGNRFDVYGAERSDGGPEEFLRGQMQGAYFPVPLTAMQAQLQFKAATADFTVGSFSVKTLELPHPGRCLGYRLQAGDSTFVLATDSEFDQLALNTDEIRDEHRAARQYEPELLNFLAGANLIVIDCQYTDDEYETKAGWGHNSIATVVDLCTQVRPDMVALFHHDPQHDDIEITRMVRETAARMEEAGVTDTLVFAAREGLQMRVHKPQPPLALASSAREA